jgi:hypothetical protein
MECREKRQSRVGVCAAITMARDLHNQQKLQQKFLRVAMKVWATNSQASFSLSKDPNALRKFNRRLH